MAAETTHVLLVEDEEPHVELVRRAFTRAGGSLRLTVVGTLAEARASIRRSVPDLVVADLILPDGRGVELLAGDPAELSYPVVVTTAYGDEQAAVEAMKRGALDYVVKSTEALASLPRTVERALREWDHIVQRRRAETELRASRVFLTTVIDTIPDPVLVLDPDGRIALANRALREATPSADWGVSSAACHQMLRGRRHPCPDEAECPLRQVLATGRPLSMTTTHARGDGETRTVDIHAAPIRDDTGQIVQVVQAWRDITDRVRAQREIASLARFPAENPYPVLRVSEDGTVLYANEAAQTALTAWGCAVGRELAGEPRDAVERAIEAGECVETELRAEGRTYLLSFAPVLDGRYVNVYGRDITQRQQLERQLRAAQRMEAIGRLAGGVAHDFNNLLTPILGYAEVLLHRWADRDDVADELGQIHDAARRGANLTRQLLAFGRKQVLRQDVVDLNELIASVMKLLRRLVRENIVLTFHPAPALNRVRGDVSQLEQVLMNLVINAGDAIAQEGEVEITTANVECGGEACEPGGGVPQGSYVMLSVRDTGCGMDAETLQRAFEPFFTTKAEGRGTGLGLATSHGIVRQHGGDIRVQSEPGAGATFRVYLPATAEPAEASDETPGLQAPRAGGDETLLVVEDDPAVLNLLGGMLKQWGYRVLVADDPLRAIELADRQAGPIDLLVTDVVLPQMNGRQLHARLTATRPELRALYISGHAHADIADHGILDAGVRFIQKPFDLADLAGKVRAVLDA